MEDDLSDRFFIAVDGFIEVLKLSTKLDKTDKGDSMGEAICYQIASQSGKSEETFGFWGVHRSYIDPNWTGQSWKTLG